MTWNSLKRRFPFHAAFKREHSIYAFVRGIGHGMTLNEQPCPGPSLNFHPER